MLLKIEDLIYDEATGARRLVGARPVEQDQPGPLIKKIIQNRGSGGHAPLGCLPLWGREGVTLANSTECLIQMISPEPHFF